MQRELLNAQKRLEDELTKATYAYEERLHEAHRQFQRTLLSLTSGIPENELDTDSPASVDETSMQYLDIDYTESGYSPPQVAIGR